jgi:hypothetical protein
MTRTIFRLPTDAQTRARAPCRTIVGARSARPRLVRSAKQREAAGDRPALGVETEEVEPGRQIIRGAADRPRKGEQAARLAPTQRFRVPVTRRRVLPRAVEVRLRPEPAAAPLPDARLEIRGAPGPSDDAGAAPRMPNSNTSSR